MINRKRFDYDRRINRLQKSVIVRALITTRQDLVADVFFQRTAIAKSLAIL